MAPTRTKGIAASAGIALFAAATAWALGEPPAPVSPIADTGRPTAERAADVASPKESLRPGSADDAATTAEPHSSTPARPDPFHSRSSRDAPGRLEDRRSPWYRTGFGALALVLALVGAAAYVARRWMPTVRANNGHLLNVVARSSLSPRHSVALVSLGRRFVLVGISGDRMAALGEISDPEEVAELTLRANRDALRMAGAFQSLLNREAVDYDTPRIGRAAAADSASSADRPDADLPANADPEGAATGLEGARPMEHDRRSVREPLTDLLRRLRTLQSN